MRWSRVVCLVFLVLLVAGCTQDATTAPSASKKTTPPPTGGGVGPSSTDASPAGGASGPVPTSAPAPPSTPAPSDPLTPSAQAEPAPEDFVAPAHQPGTPWTHAVSCLREFCAHEPHGKTAVLVHGNVSAVALQSDDNLLAWTASDALAGRHVGAFVLDLETGNLAEFGGNDPNRTVLDYKVGNGRLAYEWQALGSKDAHLVIVSISGIGGATSINLGRAYNLVAFDGWNVILNGYLDPINKTGFIVRFYQSTPSGTQSVRSLWEQMDRVLPSCQFIHDGVPTIGQRRTDMPDALLSADPTTLNHTTQDLANVYRSCWYAPSGMYGIDNDGQVWHDLPLRSVGILGRHASMVDAKTAGHLEVGYANNSRYDLYEVGPLSNTQLVTVSGQSWRATGTQGIYIVEANQDAGNGFVDKDIWLVPWAT